MNITRINLLYEFLQDVFQCYGIQDGLIGRQEQISGFIEVVGNIPRFVNHIYDPLITLQVQGTRDDTDQSLRVNMILMVVMITVSVLAVSLLIPIKMKITDQQDQVFQLFTTISREKLEGIQLTMIKNEDYFSPYREKLR